MPDTPVSETDRLDPPAEPIELVSGTKVEIQRLKLRQLFRLLRIITRGGAGYLPMLREAMTLTDEEDRAEAFGTQLIAVALIALPEAEDEAVDFIMSVVEPVGIRAGNDKSAREWNDNARQTLAGELYNPEPEDAISIIEAVINREKGDLVSLGKRLMASFNMAEKTGQLKSDQKTSASSEPTPASSAPSPVQWTSSPPSTSGRTRSSSTSVSAE